MADYATEYGNAVVKYAAGKHGTPEWNPAPHPDADPAVVANRDSDPLWQYHRNLRDYSGNMPKASWYPEKPNGYLVAHRIQTGMHEDLPTHPLPPGMITHQEASARWAAYQLGEASDADLELSTRGDAFGGTNLNEVDNPDHSNIRAYRELFDFHGRERRPWFNTIHPLQDVASYSEPHDSYGLLARSVKSGNRHSLPALVDLLKRRDNPAGWYSGWTALAKAMEERIGDLPPEDVFRRCHAIAEATLKHSQSPTVHQALLEGIRAHPHDNTPYLVLADHMDENGLPQYAQLMRLELANLEPHLRFTPRRKGSRL